MSSVDVKLAGFARKTNMFEPLEAKKKKLTPDDKKGHNRNAVPAHKGGRKETPKHPTNPKAKLLKELHEHKDVQKLLKDNPTLDIIIVDKEKSNKVQSSKEEMTKEEKDHWLGGGGRGFIITDKDFKYGKYDLTNTKSLKTENGYQGYFFNPKNVKWEKLGHSNHRSDIEAQLYVAKKKKMLYKGE